MTTIMPVIPIKKFDDVARVFVESEIDLSQITAIADSISTHYGFQRALNAVRVQLGPGKWAYVSAEPAPSPLGADYLRTAWAQWKTEHP